MYTKATNRDNFFVASFLSIIFARNRVLLPYGK